MRIEPRAARAGGIGTKRRADRVHAAFRVALADLPRLNRPNPPPAPTFHARSRSRSVYT